MKILYLDLGMGVAGDMLSASLLELISDKEGFIEKINKTGIPHVSIRTEKVKKCGIVGSRLAVTVSGEEEGESIAGHHHSSHYVDIERIIDGLAVSEKVKNDVKAVYKSIAESESLVHGESVSEIHFHEVGAMDAVADITCTAMLLEELKVDKIIATPINLGSGEVVCAHGTLPVPAPATANLIKGMPAYTSGYVGELTTPTGAALVRQFVNSFGDMPTMNISAVGYGMGKKDFGRANCVRAILGYVSDAEEADKIDEISANIDDMTAEQLAFAMNKLIESGAADVYFTPIYMKKNRPAVKLSVLCKKDDRDKFIKLMFENTTTLGVRIATLLRPELKRRIETVITPYGKVGKKVSEGYGVVKQKYEYDELCEICRKEGVSLSELLKNLPPL